MAASAYVVHRMRGRTRVRIPSQKAHPEYFAVLEKALLECPGVQGITTSAVTGSVVVQHEADLDAVVQFAADRGLFRVEPLNPESDQLLAGIHDRLGVLDAQLKDRTEGQWGLGSLSFYGLLGASVYQLYKGEFLPAGGTLFIQAFKVLVRAAEGARRPRP